jgi:hypothetical protein
MGSRTPTAGMAAGPSSSTPRVSSRRSLLRIALSAGSANSSGSSTLGAVLATKVARLFPCRTAHISTLQSAGVAKSSRLTTCAKLDAGLTNSRTEHRRLPRRTSAG